MSAVNREFVVLGASVLPMGDPARRCDAIAVRDGRILAVGSEKEALAAAGAAAERITCPGGAVLPGFIDAHHHLMPSVLYGGGFHLDAVQNLEELLTALRTAARAVPPGEFVVAHGYDPWKLTEQRHPTRSELDEACPDHPVLAVEYSFHEGVANTRALARAAFDERSEPPRGGIIGRDRRGRLDGHLAETALYVVEAIARHEMMTRDETRVLADLAVFQRRLFAMGITRICDAAVAPQTEALYHRALAEGRLHIPVVMMPISGTGIALPPHDRLEGAPTGEGSDSLKVGPLKLLFDGASRCAMCLSVLQLLQTSTKVVASALTGRSLLPLRDALSLRARIGSDFRVRTGERFYTHAGAVAMVKAAHDRGFSVGIHAIGNEAVEYALDAFAAAGPSRAGSPPPRIEHGFSITRAQARRAADLGVVFVLQPDFLRLPVMERLPRPRGLLFAAARTLLDAGVSVVASSDAPAAGFDPLDGVRSALRRRTRSGLVIQEDESIGVLETLCAYTRDAARACGVESTTGTLEPGKRADFVILNRDPALVDDASIDDLRVDQTFLAGRRVHLRGVTETP